MWASGRTSRRLGALSDRGVSRTPASDGDTPVAYHPKENAPTGAGACRITQRPSDSHRASPPPGRQAEKSRHHEQTRTGLGDETRDTKPDVAVPGRRVAVGISRRREEDVA